MSYIYLTKISLMYDFRYRANDFELAKTLSFLPEKIFDFHAHIQGAPDRNGQTPGFYTGGPGLVSIADWRKGFADLFQCSSFTEGLFFPGVFLHADTRSSNNYLVEELEKNPGSRGLVLVSPSDSEEVIRSFLAHPQVVGMKPYYMYTTEPDMLQTSIRGFFPEWMWRVAGDTGSIIMMHLMRDKAVADPLNIAEIREMCTRYPSLKLILAHVGRSFHSPNVKGIDQVSDLPNVWYDMSAVCEPEAMIYLLKKLGSSRLLWGSDFPLSHMRARPVTIGSGFIWIEETAINPDEHPFASLTMLSVESLRALQNACEITGLNRGEIDNIFYGNAMKIINLNTQTKL